MRVLVADHGNARRGWDHHRLGVGVEAHELLGKAESLTPKPRVCVHLTATGLRRPELHFHPQPLQQPHDRPASFREERVVITGDKQRSPHRHLILAETIAEWKFSFEIFYRSVFWAAVAGSSLQSQRMSHRAVELSCAHSRIRAARQASTGRTGNSPRPRTASRTPI